jgi:hypothetical protein
MLAPSDNRRAAHCAQEDARMNLSGSGGVGAVSLGISEMFVGVVILLVVLFGIWKIAKIIWAAFSG